MRLIRPNGGRPAVAILLPALAIGGCSADPSAPLDTFPRVAVSGTVTLSGTPLPQGMIQFDPAQGTTGPTAAAEISGGKFAIERSQGPVPGKYKIMIFSRAPVKIGEGEAPGGTPKLKPETIPARYNTKSTLESEVPAGGSDSLEFALKKS
jgi:hypothetical protein